jgi:hypothetical protein
MAKLPDLGTPRDTPAQNPTRARETVTVYFKEHVAWLDLQHEAPREIMENGQNGPVKRTVYYKTGDVVRIRGLSYPVGSVPDGFGDRPIVVTHNIDKEWWDEWLKTHEDYPPVKNGFLFAHTSRSEAAVIAKEHQGAPQFSPVDPKNPADKRVLKSGNPDMSGIKADDSRSQFPMR